MTCDCVVDTQPGRLRHGASERLGRHRHDKPFAAIVLAGTYMEAGDRGRMRVAPGDVILHGRFESHLDQVDADGAEVLVLPWHTSIDGPLGSIADPDSVVRLAERDVCAAVDLLANELQQRPAPLLDWPDQLAADLRRDPAMSLADWAGRLGLRPESISRGFRRAYGVAPAAFRARCRSLLALARINSGCPLASIASDCGFADQPHFTRGIRALTGMTPKAYMQDPIG